MQKLRLAPGFGKRILLCTFLLCLILFPAGTIQALDAPIIVDHTCTDLSQIPESSINQAKDTLHIGYAHTSHGSQLISGMNALKNHASFGSLYDFGNGSDSGQLDLEEGSGYNPGWLAMDLSHDYDTYLLWETREYLDDASHLDVNVIMWSWCNIGGHDISQYLQHMGTLIAEYGEGGTKPRAAEHPVQFVFMTGHANGGGENDSSDSRAQMIRQHCIDNNLILFDFADIENYDPDGEYYLDKRVEDDLVYDNEAPFDSGSKNGNWAKEWTEANPTHELSILTDECGSCAHSPESGDTANRQSTLNCVLKGRAAWWLWARLAGWPGPDGDDQPQKPEAVKILEISNQTN